VVLYNRTRKRDRWGRKRQTRREAAEVIRREAPELAIVPEDLWQRAHERLRGARAQFAPGYAHGKLWGRPSGAESKYLLTGFAVCGICGGSLYARRRSHGRSRRHFYECSSHDRRGPSVCSNDLALPMEATDRALLEAFEEDLLDPAVITRTIERAVAELVRDRDGGTSARAQALERELATAERQLGNVTQAIVLGGPIERLVAQLQPLEARKPDLVAELASADRVSWLTISHAELVAMVEAVVKDYRGLLMRQTTEARGILRELLAGRVRYTPIKGGLCQFTAEGSLGRILAGIVDAQRWWPQRDSNPCFSLERAVS
jgi:ribosomal protein L18